MQHAPMVVGSDAAHTPSRFSVLSSMPEATTSGGTHAKHAVSPGMTTLRRDLAKRQRRAFDVMLARMHIFVIP